jgi:hypothetical protein
MRETEQDEATRERELEIIDGWRKKKNEYQDYWDPIYKRARRRKQFTLLGKQLSNEEKRRYGWKNPKEPNLLLTYVNHEANKTLQTDYLGKVSPNGGGSSEQMARVRQSVLRGVQRKATTTSVLNYARRDQVASGIGYAIVQMGYAGKRGFGKTLKDEYLEDTFNVFPDINVKEPTFSDMTDFLIKKKVPENKWEEETGEKPVGWGTTKSKWLWYYWVREDIRDTEYLLEEGKTAMGADLKGEDDEPNLEGVKLDKAGQPLSRPTTDYKWIWYKIPEDDPRILDEEEWIGSYPPLVACTGRRVVDGENVYYQPITQFAEEAQIIYTILENIIALRLSKSPFSKWKVAFESIDVSAFAKLRESSQVGDMDILYKAFTADGKTIPPPEEIEPHILDAILIQLQQEQERKMQRIFGIFDANLGEKSNEQSGVAIEARKQGGEVSNYDSQYNFLLFVEQLTRIKLDMIPKVLTPQQQAAFIDKDDKEALQWLQATGGKMVDADEEYDLAIEATPISNTDRGEEAQALINLVKVAPVLGQNMKVVAIIAKAMPGKYANEVAQALSGDDPKLQQAQQIIQEQQHKLQAATAKQQQDAIAIQGMKQALGMIKQQMGLMKQQHAIEGQTSEAMKAHEGVAAQLEAMDATLDRQVEQYKAESGRISAEAAMLKVAGDLAKPEPATPAPGQGLP